MVTVIAPGIHAPKLTDEFMGSLYQLPMEAWVPPHKNWPAYSPHHLSLFLRDCGGCQPVHKSQALLFIGFSAGVVASIGAARRWQSMGGKIKALIAIDGWGVPLMGAFPIHRVSHDQWTHYTSQALGGLDTSFYADPAVEHLDLWRSPQTTLGLQVPPLLWMQSLCGQTTIQAPSVPMTAARFIHQLLLYYGEVV